MLLSGDLLGERARLTPDKTALVWVPTGARFTYAELDARAVRCARVLREVLGLAVDDRVALLADNRVEYLDLFFAAPKAGVILVPLGTRLTPHELAGILEDAAPAVVFHGAEHAETVKALRELAAVPRWVALDDLAELAGQVDAATPWQPARRSRWAP